VSRRKEGRERKRRRRTFEDDGIIVWYMPNVTKSPRKMRSFEKYPARLIGDNPKLRVLLLKILDRVDLKFTMVLLRLLGNIREFVEMRVLLESETLFALQAAEIPKNFW
jgi:hypothetical protein